VPVGLAPGPRSGGGLRCPFQPPGIAKGDGMARRDWILYTIAMALVALAVWSNLWLLVYG